MTAVVRSRNPRVGVVGHGFMGTHHVSVWRDLGVEVFALDVNPDAQQRIRERDGVRACPDLAALLQQVDVVDVCTPTDVHPEVVVAAARAGRHVICEKPLALTAEDARAMLDTCRQQGVQLHVAHVVRFFPAYAVAQHTVAEGGIGDVAVQRLRRVGRMPQRGWFADPSRSGGILHDLMVHDLDFARWIAGEVVRVYARVASPPDGGAPTRAYAVLTHASGALTHVEATWGAVGTRFTTSFELAGSTGLLEHDAGRTEPLRLRLPARAEDASYLPDVSGGDDPYAIELRELLVAITDGAPPRVSAEDGIAAVELAEAANESMRTGRAVEVGART